MTSTLKIDTITTLDGTGNITVDRPLAGSGAGLTSLPAANLTGALPAISGASLTNLPAGGKVLQVVNVMNSAAATGTTSMPGDDTIPQNTEGIEFMTLAITPTHASNKLVIEVSANAGSSGAGTSMQMALFQDSTANALAVVGGRTHEYANLTNFRQLLFYMAAGTTSETTFKVRIGTSGSTTVTFNGVSGTRKFGGSNASSITITEISV